MRCLTHFFLSSPLPYGAESRSGGARGSDGRGGISIPTCQEISWISVTISLPSERTPPGTPHQRVLGSPRDPVPRRRSPDGNWKLLLRTARHLDSWQACPSLYPLSSRTTPTSQAPFGARDSISCGAGS